MGSVALVTQRFRSCARQTKYPNFPWIATGFLRKIPRLV